MNIVYATREEDYKRPLWDACRDIHACRVMLNIIGHIMDNYEVVKDV